MLATAARTHGGGAQMAPALLRLLFLLVAVLAYAGAYEQASLAADGGASFKLTRQAAATKAPLSVVLDLNGDKLLDLAIADDNDTVVLFGKNSSRTWVDIAEADLVANLSGTVITGVWTSMAAGDFNGDGLDDLALGDSVTGVVYIFFGNISSFEAAFDVTTFASSSLKIHSGATPAAPPALFACSLAAADLNADGKDDLVIGSNASAAYVIWGNATGSFTGETAGVVDIDTVANSLKITFTPAGFGIVVASVGDMSGDSFDDIVIGSLEKKETFIFSSAAVGKMPATSLVMTEAATLNTPSTPDGFVLDATAVDGLSDLFGAVMGAAGDVNGDGKMDAFVLDTGMADGALFILFGLNGTSYGTASVLLMGDINETQGAQVFGTTDAPIKAAAALGDVNGDSLCDLIWSTTETAHVLFGRTSFVTFNTSVVEAFGEGYVINLTSSLMAISAAGDMNGDLVADVAVMTDTVAYFVYGQPIPSAEISGLVVQKASVNVSSWNFTIVDTMEKLTATVVVHSVLGGEFSVGEWAVGAEGDIKFEQNGNASAATIIEFVLYYPFSGPSKVITMTFNPFDVIPVLDTTAGDTSLAPGGKLATQSVFTASDELKFAAKAGDAANESLPSWMTVNETSGEITGTASGPEATTKITLTGTDKYSRTVTDVFNVTVENVAPTANASHALSDQTPDCCSVIYGHNYSFTFAEDSFADANGDNLVYSVQGDLPAGLTFSDRTLQGLIWAPAGDVTVIIGATDGKLSVNDSFTITVTANAAPIVNTALATQLADSTQPNATAGHHWSFTFAADTFTDNESDQFSYSVNASLPSWASFDAASRTFNGTPAEADSYTFHLFAIDVTNASNSDSFTLVVTANTAPTVNNSLASQLAASSQPNVTSGRHWSFTFADDTFKDNEGDQFDYSVNATALPSWASFDAASRTFNGTPAAADSYTFQLFAIDSLNASNSDSFTLVVTANTAPTVNNSLASQLAASSQPNVTSGHHWSFTFSADTFKDNEGDQFDYSVNETALPSWASFDAASRTFNGTPDSVANFTFQLFAIDSLNASNSDSFTLVVKANSAPIVDTQLSTQPKCCGASIGKPYSFVFSNTSFTDPDGDTITLSLNDSNAPSWLVFSPSEFKFSGTVNESVAANHTIVVRATDSGGLWVTSSFLLEVVSNQAPEIDIPIDGQPHCCAITTGHLYSFAFDSASLSDPEGENITYFVDETALPSWLTYTAANLSFSGTPTTVAVVSVVIEASDPENLTTAVTLVINVTANQPPQVNVSIGSQPDCCKVTVGHVYIFSFLETSYHDLEDDEITYSVNATALPSWLTYTPSNFTFSGTPDAAGDVAVVITIADALNATTSYTLHINVTANQAPQVNISIGNQTNCCSAVTGHAYNFTFLETSYYDPDGDTITYSVNTTALPSWLTYASHNFHGTPDATGDVPVEIKIADSTNLTTSYTLHIIVTANQAPKPSSSLSSFAGCCSAAFGVAYNYTINASVWSDPEGDTFTLALNSTLPSWLSYTYSSKQFTFSGTSNSSLPTTISIVANDSLGAVGVYTFTISAGDNKAPNMSLPIANQTNCCAASLSHLYTFALAENTFVDPEGGQVTYTSIALPYWLSFDSGTRTFSGTPNATGTYNVAFNASDPVGAMASATFSIVVGANQGPKETNKISSQKCCNASLGRPFSFTLASDTFVDPEGDNFTIAAQSLPTWLTFNATLEEFSGTPTAAGTVSATVNATDSLGASTVVSFSIVVLPNQAPQAIEDLNTVASCCGGRVGHSYSFRLPNKVFADPENDTFSIYADSSNPSWITFTASGSNSGSFAGIPLSSGNVTITLHANDSLGAIGTASFTIVVGVNHAPTVAVPLNTQSGCCSAGFGRYYSFPIRSDSFTDADNDTLRVFVNDSSAIPNGLTFDAGKMTLSGYINASGSPSVTLYVADTTNATTAASFVITIQPNKAPYVSKPLATQTGCCAAHISYPYSFQFLNSSFSDMDAGDVVTYSVNNATMPSWLTFNPSTLTFSGTPMSSTNFSVMVIGKDPFGASCNSSFLIVVGPNHAPVVNSSLSLQTGCCKAVFGHAYFWAPAKDPFSDPDPNDTRTLTVTSSASWLLWDGDEHVFSGVVNSTANVTVSATATDQLNASVTDTFVIVVSPNGAPTVAIPLSQQQKILHAYVDISASLAFDAGTFVDPENDTLNYTASLKGSASLPSWLSFDWSTRSFLGTPNASHVGTITLVVWATDPFGANVSSEFNMSIVGAGIPNATGTISNQTAYMNVPWSFVASSSVFSDPNNDYLTWTITSGPEWLSIDDAKRNFSGTPLVKETEVVTIAATNGANNSASLTFYITIKNSAPVVTAAPANKSASIGNPFSYTLSNITFTDPNLDDLTLGYVASGSASWLSFNADTGVFSGTPNASGVVTVTVYATDPDQANATATFTITSGANLPPVVNISAGSQTSCCSVVAGHPYSFQLSGKSYYDPEGGELTLTPYAANASSLSGSWLSYSEHTFSGTAPKVAGSYTFSMNLTDPVGAATTDSFTIVVSANSAPTVVKALSSQFGCCMTSVAANFTFSLSVLSTFKDAEGDDLTLSASFADGSALTSSDWFSYSSGVATFTIHPVTWAGVKQFRVTATDIVGANVSSYFNLTSDGSIDTGCTYDRPYWCPRSGKCEFGAGSCSRAACGYWCPSLQHCTPNSTGCPYAESSTPCTGALVWCNVTNECYDASSGSCAFKNPNCLTDGAPFYCQITGTCVASSSKCYVPGCNITAPYYCPYTATKCIASLDQCNKTCDTGFSACDYTGLCQWDLSSDLECIPQDCPSGTQWCSSTGACSASCQGELNSSCVSPQVWCRYLQTCIEPSGCPYAYPRPAEAQVVSSTLQRRHQCLNGTSAPADVQCLPSCPANAPYRCEVLGIATMLNSPCVETSSDCPEGICSASAPFYCRDGSCAASESQCPASPCKVLCATGGCADKLDSCYLSDGDVACSGGQVYCAYLGECVASSETCPWTCTSTTLPYWCPETNKCVKSKSLCVMPSYNLTGTSTGTVNASLSVVVGLPPTVISGTPAKFYIQAKTSDGTNLLIGSNNQIKVSGDDLFSSSAYYVEKGKYAVEFLRYKSGTLSLNVTLGGALLTSKLLLITIVKADAPQLVEALVDPSGTTIKIIFDRDTDRGVPLFSTPSLNVSCATMLANPTNYWGDSGFKCAFASANTFVITLGTNPLVDVGSSITLASDAIRSCTSASLCDSFAASGSVIVKASSTAEKTTAAITGVTTIAACPGTFVHLSGSSSRPSPQAVLHRTLTYAWSSTDLSGISSFASGSELMVPQENLSAGTAYTVALTVTDLQGKTDTATAVIKTVSDTGTPQVTVLNNARRSMILGQIAYVEGKVTAPTCADWRNALISFQWTTTSGPGSPFIVSQKTRSTAIKDLSSGTYVFTFTTTVNMADGTTLFSSDSVTIDVSAAPPVAAIDGGSRSIPASSTLVLDGSKTVYRGTNTLAYTWTCHDEFYDSDCLSVIDNNAITLASTASVTVANGTLAPGLYLFTLKAETTEGSSTATAKVLVTAAISAAAVQPPTVSIDSIGDAKVNPSQQLTLYGHVTYFTAVIPTRSWTCTEGGLTIDNSTIGSALTSSTLIILPGSLLQGTTYTFRLTAVDSNNHSAYSEITITTNSPPTGGSVSVSPTSGTPLTQFTIASDSAWVDDPADMPFRYSFSATYGTGEQIFLVPLQSSQSVSVLVPLLPANASAANVTIAVRVFDVWGASSSATASITLSAVAVSADTLTSLVTQASTSLSSSSDVYAASSTLGAATTALASASATTNASFRTDFRTKLAQNFLAVVQAALASGVTLDDEAFSGFSNIMNDVTSVPTELTVVAMNATIDAFSLLANSVTDSASASALPDKAIFKLLSMLSNLQDCVTASGLREAYKERMDGLYTKLFQASIHGKPCGSNPTVSSTSKSKQIAIISCGDNPATGNYTTGTGSFLSIPSGLYPDGVKRSTTESEYQLQMLTKYTDSLPKTGSLADILSHIQIFNLQTRNGTTVHRANLTDPVVLTFPVDQVLANETPVCVYWDTNAGNWSTDGCTTHFVRWVSCTCSCNHLSEYSLQRARSYELPTANSSSSSSHDSPVNPGSSGKSSNNNAVAIGLGVGIPLGLIAIAAVVAAVVLVLRAKKSVKPEVELGQR